MLLTPAVSTSVFMLCLSSIDFMRQKIKSKNLNYSFYRIDKEKNIDLYHNAGWHFNNILSPEKISLKLRTFAHSEYSDEKYSSPGLVLGGYLEAGEVAFA